MFNNTTMKMMILEIAVGFI